MNQSSDLDTFWKKFRLFGKFDAYGFDHWPLFTVVPVGVLVLMAYAYILRVIALNLPAAALDFFQKVDTPPLFPHWIYLLAVTTLSLCALAFNHWRRNIPTTFSTLPALQRIQANDSTSDLAQDYQTYLHEYQQNLLHPKRLGLTLGLLLFTLWITLPPTLAGIRNDHILPWPDPFLKTLDALYWISLDVISPLIWTYFLASGAWVMYQTGTFLKKLPARFTLPVQPRHPDRCGGLKWVGDFCLRLAVPILIGALFFGIISLFVPHSTVTTASNLGLIVVALPLASLAFFSPLWGIHQDMLQQKQRYEVRYARQIATLEQDIWTQVEANEPDEAKKTKDKLETLQVLSPENFPTWPFERTILIRFLSPQIIPILGLVIELSDQKLSAALASFLTLLSGK